MTTKRSPLRYNPNADRIFLPTQKDKKFELARLDRLAHNPRIARLARRRRRKVSGWVVGC
jgi:hypothetical protein